MKTGSNTHRSVVGVLVGFAVLAATAGAALAASGRPAGMSPAEYRAMMIRGQALNQLYGLGAPAGMTAAQYRAMVIRGQAMNELYARQRQPATPAPVRPVGEVATGFDWTDAGIGAAVALGVVLLGTGLAVGARQHGHWHPHPRAS